MKARSFILSLGALMSGAVLAGPTDYIFLPTVEYGEREIDFKIGTSRQPGSDRLSVATLGFGYGVTERWFTEAYLVYEKQGGEGTKLNALEWENKFQFTETGKYPVDVGLITELEVPSDSSEPYEIKIGPLLQTEFDKLQLNGNLVFERKFGGDAVAAPRTTELGYQWQVKYRWQEAFEFGLQGFGEMGKWNDWDPASEQNHRFGPAVFGKIGLEGHRAIKYNVAWLHGVSDAAPNNTLRAQIEYEF